MQSMFEQVISHISLSLGLNKKDALNSEFVKELCVDLVHGRTIIMDSKSRKIFSVTQNPIVEKEIDTEDIRPIFRQ